jgi:hypothetical protein
MPASRSHRRELLGPFGSVNCGRPEDCRTSKLQRTILFTRQQSPRDAAVVDLGPKEDELALDNIFGLKPIARAAGAM